jgi:membrane associated rhomboid family serine protease
MTFLQRLRNLFLPYLAVWVLATLGLAFISGGLVLTWQWVSIDQQTLNFWLPVAVGAIFASLVIMPRLRGISKSREPMRLIFFHLLSIALIAVPLTQSQRVVDAYFKPLVQIDALQPQQFPKGFYFSFGEMEIFRELKMDRRGIAGNPDGGQVIYLEVVQPLLDQLPLTPEEAKANPPVFFIDRQYKRVILPGTDSAGLVRIFDQWQDSIYQAEEKLTEGNAAWYSKVADPFRNQLALDAARIRDFPLREGGMILLEPHEEAFVSPLPLFLMIWGIISSAALLLWGLVCAAVRTEVPDRTEKNKRNAGNIFYNIFIPRKGYFFTPILIHLNLLMYVICAVASGNAMQFTPGVLATLGGNIPSLTSGSGQYWRLLTSVFLHGGLMHFFANMYGLYILGKLIEPLLRPGRFILSYLLAGLMGSVASLLLLPGDAVRIGASGAIFGLMGLITALSLTPLFPPDVRKVLLRSMLTTLVVNILISMVPGIDYSAHGGGLVCGAMLGFLWYPWLKTRLRKPPQQGGNGLS